MTERPEKEMGKRLTAILEAMEDGIYVVSGDFFLEFMNKSMVRDFGKGVGKKCYRVINGLDDACPWCRAGEVFSGDTVRWEHHVSRTGKTYGLTELPLTNTDGSISNSRFSVVLPQADEKA
ncbi:MAG: hypothetical protein DRH56_09325 [Deltaproteobacteria bacterium]|nr:MAG: hypothetical protein DRH56_09325 [Deltaproteobacteria bacterium]